MLFDASVSIPALGLDLKLFYLSITMKCPSFKPIYVFVLSFCFLFFFFFFFFSGLYLWHAVFCVFGGGVGGGGGYGHT